MAKQSVEDKFNQYIEQAREQLNESFPNRFIINIVSTGKLSSKNLMARILVKDTQKEYEMQFYDRFYVLGNHYMFHNFWDAINTFVLEQLKEDK